MLPISGVLLETGSISDTMVAKIVMVSIIATPENSSAVFAEYFFSARSSFNI